MKRIFISLFCLLAAFTAFGQSPCSSTVQANNNGNGSFTFIANNTGGGATSFQWNFGDGSPLATGMAVTHTYAVSGPYAVVLYSNGPNCSSIDSALVYSYNGILNCTGLYADFSPSVMGLMVNLNNTSPIPYLPGAPVGKVSHWNFGDGSAGISNDNGPSYSYANPGTYTVTLINEWTDTITNQVLCTDTVSKPVTVALPVNEIAGTLFWDSSLTYPGPATLKVWLIIMDSAQNKLLALDSQMTNGFSSAPFLFPNMPPRDYLLKAAILNGTTGANLIMPTYYDSSAHWNQALAVNHMGYISSGKNIHLKNGIYSGGPGFVSGNISAGANKGTNSGVPNILVFLRDSIENIIRFTYTDNNGDYSFGSVPAGKYTVYPENMNYITVPSAIIHLKSGSYYAGGIDFEHTSTQIIPVTTGIHSLSEIKAFHISPNPSSGILRINRTENAGDKISVSVLDLTGRNLLSLSPSVEKSITLDLSSLAAGVYLIQIKTGTNLVHTEKIILKRN